SSRCRKSSTSPLRSAAMPRARPGSGSGIAFAAAGATTRRSDIPIETIQAREAADEARFPGLGNFHIEHFRALMHKYLTRVYDLPSPSPNGPSKRHHRTGPETGRKVPPRHILMGKASGTSRAFRTFEELANVSGQRRGHRVTTPRPLPQKVG